MRKTNTFLALCSTCLLLPVAATSATFDFNLVDWSDGGVLTGSFEAEDLDGDSQISQFNGEVTSFSATYQSGQFGAPIVFDNSAFDTGLSGLVYNLDGLGTIGDSEFGDIEGLGITDQSGEFYLAVGPGPVATCDGFFECGVLQTSEIFVIDDDEVGPIEEEEGGFILATNDDVIRVTSGPLGENNGEFETNPILPDDIDENGGFVFGVDGNIVGSNIFFIDPEIAVGYTYEIDGSVFTAVQAPALTTVADGDGLYTVTYNGIEASLGAGGILDFDPLDMITSFQITGIDAALELDPTDGQAFVTGLSIQQTSSIVTITQTPITINTDDPVAAVPLPASALLLLGGVAGLLGLRRHRAA